MVKSYISGLFGTSPVNPLQKHMEKVYSCVSELNPYFEAVINQNWDDASKIQENISSLEQEADVLKKELRLNLPKNMMLPMSRRDLLDILTMQDNIANKAKDIAGLILGRKMSFPESLGDTLKSFVSRCIDATEQAQRTVNELDELVETGFRGNEVEIVEKMIKELDKIEADTDKIQVKIRAMMFEVEKDLPPVDVMFAYKVIEWIGEVADISQRVGSRLQLLLAR